MGRIANIDSGVALKTYKFVSSVGDDVVDEAADIVVKHGNDVANILDASPTHTEKLLKKAIAGTEDTDTILALYKKHGEKALAVIDDCGDGFGKALATYGDDFYDVADSIMSVNGSTVQNVIANPKFRSVFEKITVVDKATKKVRQAKDLSVCERTLIKKVRDSIPMPDENTVLQKQMMLLTLKRMMEYIIR